MDKIGLIAGNGQFPLVFAKAATAEGLEIVAIAHKGETMPELTDLVSRIYWVSVGELGRLIKILKDEGIKNAVMVGGITKTKVFGNVWPDMRALKLLSKVRYLRDDGILRAFAAELHKEGIIVRESTLYLSSILTPKGNLTNRKPNDREMKDIEFGWSVAKEIGRLDIGQCVVVKENCILAVEAIEGTDETIRRGGKLGKGDAVVVKVSKPNQDMRFDVPAVGANTIQTMQQAGASCLAIEAGKTIIFDREQMVRLAEKFDICIVGI